MATAVGFWIVTVRLAGLYQELSERAGCFFYDANLVADASPIAGVHLDAVNSRQLGATLAAKIQEIFPKS